jgi:hypothetical protein
MKINCKNAVQLFSVSMKDGWIKAARGDCTAGDWPAAICFNIHPRGVSCPTDPITVYLQIQTRSQNSIFVHSRSKPALHGVVTANDTYHWILTKFYLHAVDSVESCDKLLKFSPKVISTHLILTRCMHVSQIRLIVDTRRRMYIQATCTNYHLVCSLYNHKFATKLARYSRTTAWDFEVISVYNLGTQYA